MKVNGPALLALLTGVGLLVALVLGVVQVGQGSGDSGISGPQVKRVGGDPSPQTSTDDPASVAEVPDPDGDELPITKMEVEVDLGQFRQLLPRDAIRPVYQPRFIPGERAGVARSDLVIGVEINGEAKAYPVGPLNSREMVNDVVGGVPILVTW